MTATQPTPMAPTSDLRPEPAPAPAPAATAAELAAKPSRWARLGDHPIQTALATLAVGLLLLVLNDHGNKIDKLDTKLTERIDKVDDKLTARIDKLDDKVDEINLNLTTQINELDLKLTTQINEVNLKLTALIAGLEMTGLVDAAVEGRLPGTEAADTEPAGTEPAGAPG